MQFHRKRLKLLNQVSHVSFFSYLPPGDYYFPCHLRVRLAAPYTAGIKERTFLCWSELYESHMTGFYLYRVIYTYAKLRYGEAVGHGIYISDLKQNRFSLRQIYFRQTPVTKFRSTREEYDSIAFFVQFVFIVKHSCNCDNRCSDDQKPCN